MKSIGPAELCGRWHAPPSKSFMLRAVAAAALAPGWTRIENPSDCLDAQAALKVIGALGSTIRKKDSALEIAGGRPPVADVLDCQESGLCLRMFAALAGLFDRPLKLNGQAALRARPVGLVMGPLEQLGVACQSVDGGLPLVINGPMRAGLVKVDGSESSQFLTGLLMALPLCEGDSHVVVDNLSSGPYVRMTLRLLDHFGLRVEAKDDLSEFVIQGGQQYLTDTIFSVEGDWSGAATLLVAGALAGRVCLSGLDPASVQADKALLQALTDCGAKVDWRTGDLVVEKDRLNAFEFDASDCPDLFPALVALAINCQGKSRLAGVERLRHKESDRARVLCSEFAKLGGRVEMDGSSLCVYGGPLTSGQVDSHNDHRIAMACAVGAIGASVHVRIHGSDCVAKSFPSYYDALSSLGARVW
jgi:3-phosphoshikimate 1-carboxyvinyltransferase